MKPALVIFKLEGGMPIAFFPEIPGTAAPYTCLCYARLGQHGNADTGYAANLRRATPEIYGPLLKELKSVGYKNLKVVREFTAKHLATRKAALEARGIPCP